MKSNENITNAIYINLDSRNDRRIHIESQLNVLKTSPNGLINLTIERFSALKNKYPAIGCSMSHMACVKHAQNCGWDHVLICEDDAEFTNIELFLNQLNHFLNTVSVWDVVLLAGNNMMPFQNVNTSCVRVFNCQTTTAYIVKSHYYDTLINNYREGIKNLMREPTKKNSYAIDRYWFRLQRQHLWFLIIPLSVVQRDDYSDIENRYTNYKKMMLDLEKKYLMHR